MADQDPETQARAFLDACRVPHTEREYNDAKLRSLVTRLLEALAHLRWCRDCAEGDWTDCDDGRKARELLGLGAQP